MTQKTIIRTNLRRIGQLTGMDQEEVRAAIKTRRQVVIALVIMIIGALAFQTCVGTIPLKYTGISINDFSTFWRLM
ncbi:MAG TPA: hypothetical protein VMT57_04490 [Candidatus Thermoplasmatota archaeon]|nr:hypothetical protein [Candidatus Thermoplasmatota archaeon]